MLQAWYNRGTIMVQLWYKRGTNVYKILSLLQTLAQKKSFLLSFPATKFFEKSFKPNFLAALQQVVHPNKTVVEEVRCVRFLPG